MLRVAETNFLSLSSLLCFERVAIKFNGLNASKEKFIKFSHMKTKHTIVFIIKVLKVIFHLFLI